jgi:hypothetical protein
MYHGLPNMKQNYNLTLLAVALLLFTLGCDAEEANLTITQPEISVPTISTTQSPLSTWVTATLIQPQTITHPPITIVEPPVTITFTLGETAPTITTATKPPPPTTIVPPLATSPLLLALPATAREISTHRSVVLNIYNGMCLSCHGPNASNQFPMPASWDGKKNGSKVNTGVYEVVIGSAGDHTGRVSQCTQFGCHIAP